MSTVLMFDSCETQQCIDITIMNDALEGTESFLVNLWRTSELDHRITLNPVVAEIEITGNDCL